MFVMQVVYFASVEWFIRQLSGLLKGAFSKYRLNQVDGNPLNRKRKREKGEGTTDLKYLILPCFDVIVNYDCEVIVK